MRGHGLVYGGGALRCHRLVHGSGALTRLRSRSRLSICLPSFDARLSTVDDDRSHHREGVRSEAHRVGLHLEAEAEFLLIRVEVLGESHLKHENDSVIILLVNESLVSFTGCNERLDLSSS